MKDEVDEASRNDRSRTSVPRDLAGVVFESSHDLGNRGNLEYGLSKSIGMKTDGLPSVHWLF